MSHPEYQYLNLLRKIMNDGSPRVDRTKVGTKAIFGTQMRFNLTDGTIPIMTTKRVFWQAAVKEMLWFLTGETNIRPLLETGVSIWTDWPHAKFAKETGENISQKDFEARILSDNDFATKWGDLGPVYGKQWRRWKDYDGGEIDQVSETIRLLREDPYSRRNIIEGWNVAELKHMALTPCHKSYQFTVEDLTPQALLRMAECRSEAAKHPLVSAQFRGRSKVVHLILVQRSVDSVLGLPFNLVGASFFLRMVADQVNMIPGDLIWQGGDTHIYMNHKEAVETQLSREPKASFPKLVIKRKPETIFDYRFEDFDVQGYDHHPAIKADVAV